VVVLSWHTGSPSEKLEFSKDATEKAELISGSKSDEVQVLPTTPSRVSATVHGECFDL